MSSIGIVREVAGKMLLLFFLFLTETGTEAQSFDYEAISPHPRLLFKTGEEQKIRQNMDALPALKKVHDKIMASADELLTRPAARFRMEGKRLPVPQFDRLVNLAYAYRMTGEKKYVIRAEQEIKACCAFDTWNPSHFLDTATMVMGLAIAYDWMYDTFSPELKALIRQSILEKGFEPAKDHELAWFYRAAQNWNQVCNAGLVFGAIAIMEDEPTASQKIIEDCMHSIGLALKSYAPDGVYPEGYGYWDYGTGRNVLMDLGLESAFGTDGNLSSAKGFLESAQFICHMVGPTGDFFNYADAGGSAKAGSLPWMFWFAQKTGNPSLLYWENKYMQEKRLSTSAFTLILSKDTKWDDISAPKETMWIGHSENSLALIRTEWDNPEALYLAVKAGSGSVNHAHLDVGSFIFEAGGVRWAIDLGADNYLSLESAGVDLWNTSQNSPRWDVYRQNNRHHNTLTVNKQRQIVKAHVPLDKIYQNKRKQGVCMNLTPVYGGEVRQAVRDIAIIKKQYLEVKDFITASDTPAEIEWNMMTPAEPTIISPNKVILKKGSKALLLTADSPKEIQWEVSSAQPEQPYETPNPGVSRLSFTIGLKAKEKATLKVRMELIPQE